MFVAKARELTFPARLNNIPGEPRVLTRGHTTENQ